MAKRHFLACRICGAVGCEHTKPPRTAPMTNTDQLMALADRIELSAHGINDAFVASRWTDAQRIADSLRAAAGELRALARPEDGEAGEVFVAITPGEGYEDVAPELVAFDAMGPKNPFQWRILSTPPAPAGEDARDAARYRIARRVLTLDAVAPLMRDYFRFGDYAYMQKVDAAIDAALDSLGEEPAP